MHWQQATVIAKTEWNEHLCSLRIDAQLPEYEAGQFVSIALPDDTGKLIARPYSLVNEPSRPYCEIYFNRVEGGPLTPRLQRLNIGGSISVAKHAAGFLVLSQVQSAPQLWLLATGTGVGPFLSMLKTREPWMRFDHVVLIHGVRDVTEVAYEDDLKVLKSEYPKQFQYHHAITRELPENLINSATLTQRIPAALADGSLENLCGLTISAQDSQVLVCGNPNMVLDCCSALEEKGLKKNRRREPGQITTEVYK